MKNETSLTIGTMNTPEVEEQMVFLVLIAGQFVVLTAGQYEQYLIYGRVK